MFEWHVTPGQMWRDGKLVGEGYSGAPGFKNNVANQRLHNQGPIPQGKWRMVELIEGETPHGPYVIRLEPCIGTETFGRSGFLIHGDSIAHPGAASEGCIVVPRAVREAVWRTGDRDLQVIA